jgi:hypothetical protein
MNQVVTTRPEAGRRPASTRGLILGVATAGVVSLGMVFFSEVALRIVAPQPASWFDVYRRHPALPFYALQTDLDGLIDTGETRWSLFTDRDGYRIGKPEPQPADGPWALVVGDSFSFGTGVNYEEGFVGRIAHGSALRFVNTSVPGYGPTQYRQTFEWMLEKQGVPSLLVVSTFLGNDFHDCVWNKDVPVHDGVVGDRGDLKSLLKRNSHLYRLLSKVYHALVPQPADGVGAPVETFDPAAWKEDGSMRELAEIYEREFRTIAQLAEQRGIPLLFVVIPLRESIAALRGELPEDERDYQLATDFVTALLGAMNVRFVDATSVLASHPVRDVFFPYDGHLTPFGNELVADAVLRLLAGDGASDRNDGPPPGVRTVLHEIVDELE